MPRRALLADQISLRKGAASSHTIRMWIEFLCTAWLKRVVRFHAHRRVDEVKLANALRRQVLRVLRGVLDGRFVQAVVPRLVEHIAGRCRHALSVLGSL